MSRKRKSFGVDFEEFRALVQNLVPISEEQAEWICGEVERLMREYPELRRKIEQWGSEVDARVREKEFEEIIRHILAEAERDKREP